MVDVLVFGPHPDDIEICAGGLVLVMIAAGYTVGGVDMTAGEAGTRGNAEGRAHEAAQGAERLGLAFRENLGLPDGHIENTLAARDQVIEVIRRHWSAREGGALSGRLRKHRTGRCSVAPRTRPVLPVP
jgi:LmbE family N-acetylglucosaminyl deacetylase